MHTRPLAMLASCSVLLTLACGSAKETVSSTVDAATTKASSGNTDFRGYISFNFNVHDIVHVDGSARALDKMLDLVEEHDVKVEMYFTAPVAKLLQQQHPETVERIADSDHVTVSYHLRPPSPAYHGFDGRLEGKSAQEKAELLLKAETTWIDMESGEFVEGETGGYALVKEIFGTAPSTTGGIKGPYQKQLAQIYAQMGAKAMVTYHEDNPRPKIPLDSIGELIVRPSDFAVVGWSAGKSPRKRAWWNEIVGPDAEHFEPTTYLDGRLDEWSMDRKPFVAVLIHENNIYRQGTPWAFRYYQDVNKTKPLSPPYPQNAKDGSRPRDKANRDAIFEHYGKLFAYAKEHLCVVTSAELAELAEQYGTGAGATAPSTCPH